MLEINKRKINCPIFFTREKFIQELNHDIWREDLTLGETVNKAHSLWAEVDFLSKCPKYDQGKSGCRICKAISDIRKNRISYVFGPGEEIRLNKKTALATVS